MVDIATILSPATITVQSGNNQSAGPGAALSSPLVARVTDAAGNPVAGVPVAWRVSAMPAGAIGQRFGRTTQKIAFDSYRVGGQDDIYVMNPDGSAQTRLTTKLETIEDAIALDASVLGEQIEAKQLDAIMKLRAGGAEADQVYREGERTQGLDTGLDVLNQYLEIMKQAATEEVREIPDGVYSVKQGQQTGVYIMLRMPEELSGEVFWRFYPLGDTAHPVTSPQEVRAHRVRS